MLTSLIEAVASQGPLVISRVVWDDPVLNLGGASWSLSCTSAWRVSTRHVVVFGCWSDSASEEAKALVGEAIVGVQPQSRVLGVDPVIELSSGRFLEVFSADVVEPWVFRLPQGPTFVASPSELGQR